MTIKEINEQGRYFLGYVPSEEPGRRLNIGIFSDLDIRRGHVNQFGKIYLEQISKAVAESIVKGLGKTIGERNVELPHQFIYLEDCEGIRHGIGVKPINQRLNVSTPKGLLRSGPVSDAEASILRNSLLHDVY